MDPASSDHTRPEIDAIVGSDLYAGRPRSAESNAKRSSGFRGCSGGFGHLRGSGQRADDRRDACRAEPADAATVPRSQKRRTPGRARRTAARAGRAHQHLYDQRADADRRFRAGRPGRPPQRRQVLSAEARPRALRIQRRRTRSNWFPTASRSRSAIAAWRRRICCCCRRRRCASCSPRRSTCCGRAISSPSRRTTSSSPS